MAKIHAETKLNHYKFWTIPDKPYGMWGVKLKGQFDDTDADLDVSLPEMIGNPTTKRNLSDGDKTLLDKGKHNHLLFYKLTPVPDKPTRRVWLQNQLEPYDKDKPWVLTPPDHLLVPAAKEIDKPTGDLGPPVNWYHFACYPIKDGKPLKLNLDLFDQFDEHFKEKQNPEAEKFRGANFTPKWFGVPVSKTYEKNVHPIPWSTDTDKDPLPGTALPHIVLYEFESEKKLAKEVWVQDQFHKDPFKIPVQTPKLLGVPTDKVWWEASAP
jgi:hypothetical protein